MSDYFTTDRERELEARRLQCPMCHSALGRREIAISMCSSPWHDRGVQPPATPQEPTGREERCPSCDCRMSHSATCRAFKGQTWQPIETAPKDGQRVLLFHHLWQAASTGQFYGARQGWKLDSTLPPFTMQPTYWMPPPDVLPLLRCALLIPEESET